jgi:predicted phage tail protein
MKAHKRKLWSYGAALLLTGCGYVGDPLYPALNIPSRVIDLSAIERGSNLDVNFTIPPLTTEGLAVKQIGGIELRVGPNKSDPFNTGQWASAATKVEVPAPNKTGPVHLTFSVQPYIGQEVIVGVRAVNAKGRASEWSNFVTLRVQPPLATPAELRPQLVPQGVLLSWKASGEPSFHIIRKAQEEQQATQIGVTTETQYLDAQIQYGKTYEYWVQGINGEVQSEYAGPVTAKPEDKFPPAVPSRVAASAGLQTIELAWERNTEPDFKGYRVYRTIGDGPFEKIADMIEAPSFSDNKTEPGMRYRYAVSAVDQTGNESERSAPVEATAPQK